MGARAQNRSAATQRQQRGLIPAWASGPGPGRARLARAESPAHPPLARPRPTHRQGSRRMGRAFSPLALFRSRPGPLAQAGMGRAVGALTCTETARPWRAKCPNSSAGQRPGKTGSAPHSAALQGHTPPSPMSGTRLPPLQGGRGWMNWAAKSRPSVASAGRIQMPLQFAQGRPLAPARC